MLDTMPGWPIESTQANMRAEVRNGRNEPQLPVADEAEQKLASATYRLERMASKFCIYMLRALSAAEAAGPANTLEATWAIHRCVERVRRLWKQATR